MEMYFHPNSREPYFLYKFLMLGPLGNAVACCLAFNASFFFFFLPPLPLETFTFTAYYRKLLQARAKRKCFGDRAARTERKRSILMEKRHQCLAAEVRRHACSFTNTPPPALDVARNALLAASSGSAGQTLILRAPPASFELRGLLPLHVFGRGSSVAVLQVLPVELGLPSPGGEVGLLPAFSPHPTASP